MKVAVKAVAAPNPALIVLSSYPTVDSRVVIAELVRNFLEHEFVISREDERDFSKKLLAQVTVDDINSDLETFGGAENRASEISLPVTEKPITEDRVKAIIAEVDKSDIPAWVEKAVPTTPMTNPPKPGKITKQKTYEKIGVYQWTLSNGATVTSEGLNGSASAKDLEPMMQLAYLRVTAPRKDEEQFKQLQLDGAEALENQERSPQFQYYKRSLDKIKQIYTRGRETDLRTNRFWSQRLTFAFRYKDDPNDIPDTSKTLARMTSDHVKAAAKHFLDPRTLFQAVQLPIKPDAAAPAKK